MAVEIYRTARSHGVSEADTHHAIDHALVVVDQDDERVLYLGPDRAGNLLEVVALHRVGQEDLVVHSMAMTHKYESLLQGLEDNDG